MKRLPVFPILFSVFLFACSAAAAVSTPQDADKASGSLLFQDDFSSAATGWRRFASPEGVMDYDAAGYRVLVNALNTNFWATANRNFADVRIEADAGKLGGPDANRIGLVCRFSNDTYYFFMISSDG
ncbi:MAG: hypothetical protein LDL50_03035, partial [Chloroflexi bacterium]|nr:hypothetical protein [Chloroflexota bacterium]